MSDQQLTKKMQFPTMRMYLIHPIHPSGLPRRDILPEPWVLVDSGLTMRPRVTSTSSPFMFSLLLFFLRSSFFCAFALFCCILKRSCRDTGRIQSGIECLRRHLWLLCSPPVVVDGLNLRRIRPTEDELRQNSDVKTRVQCTNCYCDARLLRCEAAVCLLPLFTHPSVAPPYRHCQHLFLSDREPLALKKSDHKMVIIRDILEKKNYFQKQSHICKCLLHGWKHALKTDAKDITGSKQWLFKWLFETHFACCEDSCNSISAFSKWWFFAKTLLSKDDYITM